MSREVIDQLYLELSIVTTARTWREILLQRAIWSAVEYLHSGCEDDEVVIACDILMRALTDSRKPDPPEGFDTL